VALRADGVAAQEANARGHQGEVGGVRSGEAGAERMSREPDGVVGLVDEPHPETELGEVRDGADHARSLARPSQHLHRALTELERVDVAVLEDGDRREVRDGHRHRAQLVRTLRLREHLLEHRACVEPSAERERGDRSVHPRAQLRGHEATELRVERVLDEACLGLREGGSRQEQLAEDVPRGEPSFLRPRRT